MADAAIIDDAPAQRLDQYPGLVQRAQKSGAWGNVGKLKRLVRDDIVQARAAYAKRVMQDREKRREAEAAK